ncbi:hypothetical protein PSPO01_05663 [Paraphaeosphaeria sporulosa]
MDGLDWDTSFLVIWFWVSIGCLDGGGRRALCDRYHIQSRQTILFMSFLSLIGCPGRDSLTYKLRDIRGAWKGESEAFSPKDCSGVEATTEMGKLLVLSTSSKV